MELKAKRILIYTAWYPDSPTSLEYPFVSQQVKILHHYITENQLDCKLVVWHDEKPIDIPALIKGRTTKNEEWEDEKIKVFHTKGLVFSHRINSTSSLPLKRMRARTFNSICSYLGEQPDCVWTVTLSAALNWAMFSRKYNLNIPFFMQEHSTPITMHLKNRRSFELAKALNNSLSKVIVVAERQLNDITTYLGNINTEVIWNPVDPCFLKEPDFEKINQNSFLFVGRLSNQKGLQRLLEAWSIVNNQRPELLLRIIGFGELEGYLRNFIRENSSLKIEYLGAKNKHEIFEELSHAGAYILPSYYENCPVSLLEAQVVGVPALVTANNASEKVLLEDCGLVVDTSVTEVECLAKGIIQIFDNLGDFNRKRIRQKALKQFSPDVFVKRLIYVINFTNQ